MEGQNKGRLRLSIRLAILVFLVEAILLGSFAVIVYIYSRKVFFENFDFALQANAESLATLVEHDDEDGTELEFADEVMRRFSREKRPDLFAILLENDKILEKSQSLENIPSLMHDSSQKMRFCIFQNHGNQYRGVVLPVFREMDGNSGRKFLIRIFFASSTHKLEEDLEKIAEFLAWFFGAGLLLSGLLAWIVSKQGLAPLRRLAQDTGKIGEESISQRLVMDYLPADLLPTAKAVNDLLDRLEKAFEKEKRFSSDAAHELRTPVTTLKSGIQAALLTKPNPGEDRRVLRELLIDVERLEALCDSLLLLAKDQMSMDKAGLSVLEWIEEISNTIESLQPLAETNKSQLIFKFQDNLPPEIHVNADSMSTRRIAMNLVDNAIRHCPEKTKISVEVELNKNEVFMVVRDNGSGVNYEDESHLFERFFRTDKSRTRSTGGVGLGLAISRTLARLHGGDISYQPVKPHGSEFTWRSVVKGKD